MNIIRYLCLLGALAGLLAGPPALAQDNYAAQQVERQRTQPLNNAPLWKEVRSGQPNVTTVRGVDTGVLIQSGGQTWRALRNGPITLYGGIVFCAMLVGLAVFYKARGEIKLSEPPAGRQVQRFSGVERAAHWAVAGSFCILAVTGLITLFGKYVLLPLFGYTLFAIVAQVSKYIHNFVGPVFLLSIIWMFVLFVRDNVWQPVDALWIRKAGGLFSGEHVPSYRFNFGEKTWFWLGVVFLGLAVSATGLILNFPNFQQGREVMQIANIIHVTGALIVITLSLAHIYIGTVGMEGALDSMRSGYVDEVWAKEHHEYWYDEAKRRGEGADAAAPGTAAPAGTPMKGGAPVAGVSAKIPGGAQT